MGSRSNRSSSSSGSEYHPHSKMQSTARRQHGAAVTHHGQRTSSARAARQPIPSHCCCHFAYKRVSRTCRTSLFLGDSQVTSVFRTALVQPSNESRRKSSQPDSVYVCTCVRACVSLWNVSLPLQPVSELC